jgi:outer membrane protein OmpA-like peptidoglycan-associated protein
MYGRIGALHDAPLLSDSSAAKGWLGSLIVLIGMMLSGCGGVILVGAGVGAGAFSYFAGNVIRVYEADYQQSIEAGSKVMERLVFKGKEETEDGVRTVIEGYFDSDTPVTIEVVFVDPGSTQIGVRTGYIGNDNLEISEQLHADIAGELGKIVPSTLQGNSEKEKISEPLTLKATAYKKKVQPADDQLRVSRSLYDDLPPPPKSNSAAAAGEQNMRPVDFGQETQTSPRTENEQAITEQFQTKATENEDALESPRSEMIVAPVGSVSPSTINEPENTFSIDFGQRTQSPSPSEDEQDITEQFQTEPIENEAAAESSASETISVATGSFSPSTAGEPEDSVSVDEGQDRQISFQTEKDQDVTEQVKTNAAENEAATEPPISEMSPVPEDSVWSETAGEPEDSFSNNDGSETQTPFRSDNEQENAEQLQARVTEMAAEVESPLSESVPVPQDSDLQGREDMHVLLIPERSDKIFTYHPESERTIHSGSYDVLDEVIAYLNENPAMRVDIRAYINSSSNRERELKLTQKRVYEIRNYLILNGVSEQRIMAQGLGESNFLEINRPEREGSQKQVVKMIVR